MDILKNTIAVSDIKMAVFVPSGMGAPIHRDRPTHGLAYHAGKKNIYRFSTGESFACEDGSCIYLPKGSNYTVEGKAVEEPKGAGVYAINFLTAEEALDNRPFLLRVKGKEEMLSAFSRAERAWKSKTVGFTETCFSELYRILRLLKVEQASYAPQKRTLDALAPALAYINEHYTEGSVSLSRLAELCEISEPYLRRLFQRAFCVSPAVYMRNLRLKYAKELLRAGGYSISEAAMLSGFGDIAYFSREFKKATGVSPKEFTE